MSNWNVGDAAIDRAREFNSGWSAAPTAPSIIPALPRDHDYASQHSAEHPRIPRCPELDCVRDLLTPSAIAFAELRAAETGVGADRALIAAGMIAEEIGRAHV